MKTNRWPLFACCGVWFAFSGFQGGGCFGRKPKCQELGTAYARYKAAKERYDACVDYPKIEACIVEGESDESWRQQVQYSCFAMKDAWDKAPDECKQAAYSLSSEVAADCESYGKGPQLQGLEGR